jgi:glycosyltransferase involved in cell wall biosynthesis
MKILLVNNFFYNRGGDCTYMFSLKKLLEEKGHKVMVFSMDHPRNFHSEYSDYFVSYINYDEEVKNVNLSSGINVLKRTVYSREAKKKIEGLLKHDKPDIVHLQNIHHHITPSVFYPIKKYKIPLVWTLHDYTVICPNTSFLSHGRVCEKCKKRKYYWSPIVKCKKNSLVASTMAAIETTLHRIMGVNKLVDAFITPSEFLRNKLIEYGFNKERIVCVNNFSNVDLMNKRNNPGDYYLYVGRITEEKGIKTLIDAAIAASIGRLKIVGEGPLKESMISYVDVNNGRNIEFLGQKSHDEVMELIRGSTFVVVPSEWYENYPFAVLEAFSCGKPVIGSRIGGIPELIKDTERGLIFETGDSTDLIATIKYLLNNPDIIAEMGRNAEEYLRQELNGERHYKEIIRIYKKVSGYTDGET